MENNNKKKIKCRIWWPKDFEISANPVLLFGWIFNSDDKSVDLVVASVVPFDNISSEDFQDTLKSINKKLPTRLKAKALFTLIGHCNFSQQNYLNGQIKDEISQTQRGIFIKSGTWAEILLRELRKAEGYFGNKERRFVPVVCNLHLDLELFENCDCHVIVYDCPIQGKNHYSLTNWGISKKTGTNLKKPKWIRDLENKPSHDVSESVILSLNCSNFTKLSIEERAGINRPVTYSFFLAILNVIWNCVAFCVASISTIVYIFLQLFHKILTLKFNKGLFILNKIFPYSCKNIQIRSCQFLYWPVFLQDMGFSSSNPNVEFAHKSSLKTHFILSNIITNTTIGLLFSFFLLKYQTLISLQISTTSHLFTNTILRSGFVWLMGAPAGFKLNTQLAKLLGTISLNVVQLYSAIWYVVGRDTIGGIIVGVAIAGVAFGASLPLGFLVDLVKLGSVHVAGLHWLVSVLYKGQIQALASLWRIFRGIKWNPLRQRIDSYNYTVEQHIVTSLLFTPLLLILPTTSVFYIFFTILNTQIALVCFSLEILISALYAAPFWEILIWVCNKRRFPLGIWFQNYLGQKKILVSEIKSNYATLGQVIGPHYKQIFNSVPSCFARSLAYGVLSGQRIPSNLNTNLPPLMPWMNISFINYWKLCYGSILASRSVQIREIKGQK